MFQHVECLALVGHPDSIVVMVIAQVVDECAGEAMESPSRPLSLQRVVIVRIGGVGGWSIHARKTAQPLPLWKGYGSLTARSAVQKTTA
ncbi:hypothetical protein Tco_0872792 [Tanacetum coccineum]